MNRIIIILIIFSSLVSVFIEKLEATPDDNICEFTEKIITELSVIRELTVKNEVPCLKKNKSEVTKYLEESLDKKFTADKIKYESLTFRALGLVPWSYDYKNELISLYKDQIGGYYDPEKKHFVMASWLPKSSQENVLAHELTHALQDQHFNLEKVMDPNLTTDEILARSALVEGDATFTMLNFSKKTNVISADEISTFILSNLTGASLNKSLRTAPLGIQSLVMFPYNSGLRFVSNFREKNNLLIFNNLFINPPKTTKEILEEKKFNYSKITKSCEELSKDLNFDKIKYEDRIGDFLLKTLLKDEIKNKEINLGWEDDQLCIFKKSSADEDEEILSWSIYLDSEKKALKLSEFLSSHFKKLDTPNIPYKIELDGKTLNLSIFFQTS